jgi:hypothetical protein
MALKSKDNISISDDCKLQVSKPGEPKDTDPKKGSNIMEINMDDYEYVLLIPKTFRKEKVRNPDGSMGGDEVMPAAWCPGVRFFINGVDKSFRELEIILSDPVNVDRGMIGRATNFPRVIING